MEDGLRAAQREVTRVFVDEKLNMIWQCVFVAQQANYILGCIKHSMASMLREMILPLHCRGGGRGRRGEN